MKTITHDKTFLSHLRACLAAPLRWLKLDGKDRWRFNTGLCHRKTFR